MSLFSRIMQFEISRKIDRVANPRDFLMLFTDYSMQNSATLVCFFGIFYLFQNTLL